MRIPRNILSFFFLGIFGLLMLHQVVPHYHHSAEKGHADQHAAAPEHSHGDHHHDNDSEQKEKPFDFLAFLLGGHINLPTTTETPAFQHHITEEHLVQQLSVASSPEKEYVLQWLSEEPPIYQPPNLYSKLYVNHLSLRGPPASI